MWVFIYVYNYTSGYNCVYVQLCLCTYLQVSNYTDHMIIYTYLFFVWNGLHLIKICLIRLVDMHLYSKNLTTIAMISSLIVLELTPVCFSCNVNFNLSPILLGSDDRNKVFDSFGFWFFGFEENFFQIEPAMIAGDLSNHIIDSSQGLLRPFRLKLNFNYFLCSYIIFRSCRLEWSTLKLYFLLVSNRFPSNLKDLLVSLKVNILLYEVIGILVFMKTTFILIELWTFINF